jgi:hypothetical protein
MSDTRDFNEIIETSHVAKIWFWQTEEPEHDNAWGFSDFWDQLDHFVRMNSSYVVTLENPCHIWTRLADKRLFLHEVEIVMVPMPIVKSFTEEKS